MCTFLFFLQWGGDVVSRHSTTADTVLHVVCSAAGQINVNLVQFLLNAYDTHRSELLRLYADLPVNLLNSDGLTPLMLAANTGMHYYYYFYYYFYYYIVLLCICWTLNLLSALIFF